MHIMYTLFHEPLKKVLEHLDKPKEIATAKRLLSEHIQYNVGDSQELEKQFKNLFHHVGKYNEKLKEASSCFTEDSVQAGKFDVIKRNIKDAIAIHDKNITPAVNKIIELSKEEKKDTK